jgi:hypothetical protein
MAPNEIEGGAMSHNTNPRVEIFVSTDGIDTISVPYQFGSHSWLEVLSRSAWAIDLLNGTIRHHSRSITKSAAAVRPSQL